MRSSDADASVVPSGDTVRLPGFVRFDAAVYKKINGTVTLNLAQINDKRQRLLYEGKAVPLKEVQQAQGTLDAAENDVRSADVALEASRNRLRILGKTDQEITEFQTKGTINPATPIYAPIGGTIVQRKVGPGQYVGSGASDRPMPRASSRSGWRWNPAGGPPSTSARPRRASRLFVPEWRR